mmetsp:Transcript_26415/g.62055  ORF Transcript_26415/g.62055 Transcript_26415/m.62055 type:complete len:136 (+) Transcript_26415:184-591(+)
MGRAKASIEERNPSIAARMENHHARRITTDREDEVNPPTAIIIPRKVYLPADIIIAPTEKMKQNARGLIQLCHPKSRWHQEMDLMQHPLDLFRPCARNSRRVLLAKKRGLPQTGTEENGAIPQRAITAGLLLPAD